jgi:hypothetical protein
VERACKQTGCLSTDKGKFLLPSPDFFIASFSALPASVSLDPIPSSAKSAYPEKRLPTVKIAILFWLSLSFHHVRSDGLTLGKKMR